MKDLKVPLLFGLLLLETVSLLGLSGLIYFRYMPAYYHPTVINEQQGDQALVRQGYAIGDQFTDHGAIEWRRPDGSRSAVQMFEYGQPHGLSQTFFPGGRVESELRFYYGLECGRQRRFDENGQVIGEEERVIREVDGKPASVPIQSLLQPPPLLPPPPNAPH
ncbi:MAG: hypothetical protein JO317_05795 [Verrucomicrobiae bacterium]|nr:hypothetical protein [Verrucomicrobiae bacterium]